MDFSQVKKGILLAPQTLTAGATNSSSIDTLGGNFLVITALFGSVTTSCTVLKLQDSPDNSTFADVTGDYNGDLGSVAPTDSDDNVIVEWYVDLRGLERYVRVQINMAGLVAIEATLHLLKIGVKTAAERGLFAMEHVTVN